MHTTFAIKHTDDRHHYCKHTSTQTITITITIDCLLACLLLLWSFSPFQEKKERNKKRKKRIGEQSVPALA
jgi:Mn2+/Fe2+ NRAMP family transporter